MIELSLQDKMPWGKHKGEIVSQVPLQYLSYAINSWGNVKFDEEVKSFVKKSMSSQNYYDSDDSDDSDNYTDYQKSLIRQYKNCIDGPNIHDMRRNGLDYDDIWC